MPGSSETTRTDCGIVCVDGVTVDYGKFRALEGISFDLQKGQVAAVIGPNGSGKTTLIRALLGLVPLKKGSIHVFGEEPKHARTRIGYVPQKFSFDTDFPLTVGEFLHLTRRPGVPADRPEDKLKEVGLVPGVMKKRLGSLSGGQLQRVLIASAIMSEPDILILDEPATGIDVVGEATFYDAIHHLKTEHDTTVIIVSHDIGVVSKFVDQVICINQKMMCAGPPKTALTDENLQELFGHHASYYGHMGHGTTTHTHRGKH